MKPTVIVAGSGRCGSSLVMQMLAAGGMSCAGKPPLYEHADVYEDAALTAEWVAQWGAVKMLVPYKYKLGTDIDALVIWLDRDPVQQSRSHRKYLEGVTEKLYAGFPEDEILNAYRNEFKASKTRSLNALKGHPRLGMTFEELVQTPIPAASRISRFVARYGWALDVGAMAATVAPRSASCLPDLSFELSRMGAA